MELTQRVTFALALISALLIGGVAAIALTGSGSVPPVSASERADDRGISVSGEGQVSIVPDTAWVTLGVQLEGEELEAIREEANERMDAVISGFQADGVTETDIRTVTYDISVKRDWEREGQPIIGYIVFQLVEVKITDLDATGAIIDNALDNGANTVANIRFEVDDRADAIRQAREAAMTDARDKAEHLAELGGVTLGAPKMISESSPSLPPIYYDVPEERAMADDGMMVSPIEPGESLITVHVNVVYEIE